MAKALMGMLRGKVITLETAVPPLDGKRVRVTVEAVGDSDVRLAPQAQADFWSEWTATGPQGPLEDDGSPEFPA